MALPDPPATAVQQTLVGRLLTMLPHAGLYLNADPGWEYFCSWLPAMVGRNPLGRLASPDPAGPRQPHPRAVTTNGSWPAAAAATVHRPTT